MKVFRKSLVLAILAFLSSFPTFSQKTFYALNPPELVILSTPNGADVVINNVNFGKTPLRIPLENYNPTIYKDGKTIGDYRNFILSVTKEGYEDYTEYYICEYDRNYKNQSATFKITLEKSPESINPVVIRDTILASSTASNPQKDNIIRWKIQSDPNGARIFWRILSNTQEVKSTNENFLASTPYEETRSFNIPGLTYENSSHVTMEIKVTKRGYVEQVKRFNLRMALDQQEINSFFELYEE